MVSGYMSLHKNLMNKEILLSRILKLKEYFDSGKIPTLSVHEIHPNLPKEDRLNYLYFTLPVSLNFQRSSPAMWQAAFKTFTDPETNYLFYPEKVVTTEYSQVQNDLQRYKLSLQKNKHTKIWIAICSTLNKYFNNDPREIFRQKQFCATRVKNLLQKESKKDFPYLSGIKMSNYWLYILTQFTDIQLRNKHKISIIPDTHVMQSSLKLGLIDSLEISREEVEKVWFEVLKGSELIPIDMHPVLWNWSRNNFIPEV